MKRDLAKELRNAGFDIEEKITFKNGNKINMIEIKVDDSSFLKLYIDEVKDVPIEEIIEAIKSQINKKDEILPDLSLLKDKEYILYNVYIGIQKRSDEPIIKKEFFEYDKYMFINLGNFFTVTVNQDLIDSLDITEEELWEKAELNTIDSLSIENNSEVGGVIISNDIAVRGAGVITVDKNVKKIKEFMNTDKVIFIPSCIHGLYALPYDEVKDMGRLLDVIKDINNIFNTDMRDKLGDIPIIL